MTSKKCWISGILATIFSMAFIACSNPVDTPSTPTVTNVTISPATAFVERGGTLDFTATVDGTNDPPQGVTWEIGWVGWQGSTVWGTITGEGTTINSSGGLTVSATETLATFTVRATETFTIYTWDRLIGEATVTVPVPPTPTVTNVTVSPATAFVERGGTLDFTVMVDGTNDPPQGVTWEVFCGNWGWWDSATAYGTTINSSGGLTVSSTEALTTLTVRATSTFNTSINGEATVSVIQPTVTSVTVSPATASVERGGTRGFVASVMGTNNPPQDVTWSIVESTSWGTSIDDNGVLTVDTNENLTALTVRATSASDTSVIGTASVTIPTATWVTVSPATATVGRGGILNFTATVGGVNNPPQGVTWFIDEGWIWGTQDGTTINSSGGLTVSPTETLATLTVRATSMADTSISGTATVTVLIPTVTSVTVSPAAISVARGGTHNFTATVAGTNNPPQGVIWEILCDGWGWGNTTVAGTTINSSGGLTVSAAETQTVLTVRATETFSTWNNRRSGEATVTVPQP